MREEQAVNRMKNKYSLKNIKRLLIVTAIMFDIIIMFVSCKGRVKNKEQIGDNTQFPIIEVFEEEITNVPGITTPTPKPTDTNKYNLVPPIKQNLSNEIDLSYVDINGFRINIEDLTKEELLLSSKLNKRNGKSEIETNFYYYNGGMFSSSENSSAVAVEFVNRNGKLVPEEEYDKYNDNDLVVKGVYSSLDFVKDDNVVSYYAGIKSGMEKDTFIAIMGEGLKAYDYRVYSNKKYVLIVSFATSEKEEKLQVVDEITLLKIN